MADEITAKKRFDTTKLMPLLVVGLIGAAFFIGNLSAKVAYLEKGGQGGGTAVAGTQGQGGAGQQAGAQPPATSIDNAKFEEIVKAGRHVIGEENAPVTIVEFSDFQCPFCGRFFTDALPQIKKEYIESGKAKLVYMQFPLTSIHPDAMNAALASECAAEQGKFEAYHDALFANQTALSVDSLKKYAADMRLNTGKFDSCLDSQKYKAQVDADTNLATSNGINGTPGFFINGALLSGAQPFANFKTVIEEALKS